MLCEVICCFYHCNDNKRLFKQIIDNKVNVAAFKQEVNTEYLVTKSGDSVSGGRGGELGLYTG